MYRIAVCDGLEYGKRLVRYLELHANGDYRIYSFSSFDSLDSWGQSADLYLLDEQIFLGYWKGEEEKQEIEDKVRDKNSYHYHHKPVILLSNEDKPGCFCRFQAPRRLRQFIEDILFPEKGRRKIGKKHSSIKPGTPFGKDRVLEDKTIICRKEMEQVTDEDTGWKEPDIITGDDVDWKDREGGARASVGWNHIEKHLERNPFSKATSKKESRKKAEEDKSEEEMKTQKQQSFQLLGLYVPIHYGNLDQIIEEYAGEHSLIISMEDLNYMESRHPNTSDLCYYIHIREEQITTRLKELVIHRGERDWIINQDLYFDLTELKAEDYAWFFDQLREQKPYDKILVIFGYAASHDASFFYAFDQLILLGIEGHRALQSLLGQIKELMVRTDPSYEQKVVIAHVYNK